MKANTSTQLIIPLKKKKKLIKQGRGITLKNYVGDWTQQKSFTISLLLQYHIYEGTSLIILLFYNKTCRLIKQNTIYTV